MSKLKQILEHPGLHALFTIVAYVSACVVYGWSGALIGYVLSASAYNCGKYSALRKERADHAATRAELTALRAALKAVREELDAVKAVTP